ncbi:MAG: LON peptidase substrate-binding domain-containing protein, partial [Deltaproteobacteria bacterium]|nr:LON peptidase substrate-binding domain-containing protein [Deltaproteobacteria bacterium]
MSEKKNDYIDEQDVSIEANSYAYDGSSEGLVIATDILPSQLPIIPLRPRPSFPGLLIPLAANGPMQIAAIKKSMETASQAIGLVMVKDLEKDDGPDNLCTVGVVAKILKVLHTDDDTTHVMVNCLERFKVTDTTTVSKLILAKVDYHFTPELSVNPELKAYSMAIISTLKELVQINPLYSEEIKLFLNRSSMDDPARLADFAANLTSADGY